MTDRQRGEKKGTKKGLQRSRRGGITVSKAAGRKVAGMERPSLKIETVPIESVSRDPSNARTHTQRSLEAIKGSLRQFGQRKPIVVDLDGIIRAGNGTHEAAEALGWATIDIVRMPARGAAAIAYGIADNRTTDISTFDDSLLVSLLRGLESDEDLLRAIAFSEEELNALFDIPPMFDPVSEDEQSQLDEKAPITCPKCGHEFVPKS